MGFLVSPGVEVNEIDLTNVIPAVSTSIGGFVGEFRWGPVGEAITVSSEKELASYYGAPTDDFAKSFLTAASFLKYGTTLKISRAIKPSSVAATVASGSITTYKSVTQSFPVNAKYLGALGNSLQVYIAAAGAIINSAVSDSLNSPTTGISTFSSAYQTTDSQGSEVKDEIHIVVVDEDGEITGKKGTILEVWEGLSLFTDAKKEDGSNLYFKDVINDNSSWIQIGTVTGGQTRATAYTNSGTASSGSATLKSLASGSDGSGSYGYDTAAEVFRDTETMDVNFLFTVDNGSTGLNPGETKIIDIVNDRKDCIAFISAPDISSKTSDADRLSDVTDKFEFVTSTSYVVLDSTPLYVYNKYSDKYIWIPACGHMAGLCANTDDVAEPWFSPAGYNRGQLLGVTKLAFNPKQTPRDTLYKARINPIVAFPGQGILLFGDKTAQAKPSAFDRINVRRLFITLEKAISTAAKYQLFELNDEFTRAMFRNMVEPFLREVKGRRGVTDFLVICDETNNTGEVIDTNRFVADIYIKPARSINFITLNFIATRTGVEFSEIVGK